MYNFPYNSRNFIIHKRIFVEERGEITRFRPTITILAHLKHVQIRAALVTKVSNDRLNTLRGQFRRQMCPRSSPPLLGLKIMHKTVYKQSNGGIIVPACKIHGQPARNIIKYLRIARYRVCAFANHESRGRQMKIFHNLPLIPLLTLKGNNIFHEFPPLEYSIDSRDVKNLLEITFYSIPLCDYELFLDINLYWIDN